jgi:hypothetical protein
MKNSKYRWSLSIGFSEATQRGWFTCEDMDYSKEEWEALTPEQREATLEGYSQEMANNYINIWWETIND